MMNRSLTLASCFLALLYLSSCGAPKTTVLKARPSKICTDSAGLAIQGYDTVNYFIENKAVKGISDFSFSWNGAKWLFSTKTNRDLFEGNPDKFAPQYGGWCALSTSGGDWLPASPNAWTIKNGKLYFFVNGVPKFISSFVPNWIAKADENWSKANAGSK